MSFDPKKRRHDLKNALSSLKIFVDLVGKDFDFQSADGSEMIAEAKSSVELLQGGLDDLLQEEAPNSAAKSNPQPRPSGKP